jgi:hypothetical protein
MKQRVVIQDLHSATMPVITEMIVSDVQAITGDLIRFEHDNGSVTIINIASGWNVSISEYDED